MTANLCLPRLEDLQFNEPIPFNVRFDPKLMEETRQKLQLARFPEEQDEMFDDVDEDDAVDPAYWPQGAKVANVRRLAEYWRDEYDWKKQEKELNTTFKHFLVKVDVPTYGELVLHYTHNKSPNEEAIPLLFCHGWPGSFMEAAKLVGPLTNPDNPKNPSFNVVVPSIPGFGFSPAPSKVGVGPSVMARALKILMTEVLGYKWFVTQGGDFGAFITRSLAWQYPSLVRAQHLNMFPAPFPTLLTAPISYVRWCLWRVFYSTGEYAAWQKRLIFQQEQQGYMEEQKTKPQTLGFALGDSPVGLLAWFLEKFNEWADVSSAFTPDTIINLVMMHWIQGATPGLRFYRESFNYRREAERTFEAYISCPTGVSMYAKEPLHCPKDWAQKRANIQFWKEYEVGGHFPSIECPILLITDIRQFFRSDPVQKSISKARR